MTNISTFVIYAASVRDASTSSTFTIYPGRQRTGFAGIVTLVPTSCSGVVLLGIGKLAARYGPRPFASLARLLHHGVGLLWLARILADSQGWMLGGGRSRSTAAADYS